MIRISSPFLGVELSSIVFTSNPFSPKSDHDQISLSLSQCFVKQRGHENYGHDRVGFFRRFGLKTGIHLAHFGLESGMVFEGTTECMNVFIVSIPNE